MKREKLRQARIKKGLSQQVAAELIGVSRNAWSLWERGKEDPYPVNVKELCTFFGVDDPGDLDLAPRQVRTTEASTERIVPYMLTPLFQTQILMETKEREAISASQPSLFQIQNDVLSRISTILSKPTSVEAREITYFDQQTRLYWRAREETIFPANVLYTYVVRHLDNLTILLARSLQPKRRLALCETLCRTILLGGILLYDMGQYTKARYQYHLAFQAAFEANNSLLQAIVQGWMSFTWTYGKNYTEAMYCIQKARYFAEQASDSLAQTWLTAIEAEIQAHLQNRDACLQALTSLDARNDFSSLQETSYLFEFNPVLLLGYKGICLQQLYRKQEPATYNWLQEAKEALEQALIGDAPAKRKLYYLSDLAGVYARQGEVEMACTYVAQSIPLVIQIGNGSTTIRQHLQQVRVLLQPYEQFSSVQHLDEQMAFSFRRERTGESDTFTKEDL